MELITCRNCKHAKKNLWGDVIVYTCNDKPTQPDFYCAYRELGEPEEGFIQHSFRFDEEEIDFVQNRFPS